MFRLAAVVAEYAEILRESYWAQEGTLEDVAEEASRLSDAIPSRPDIDEFVNLVSRAESIQSKRDAG